MRSYDERYVDAKTPVDVYKKGDSIAMKLGELGSRIILNFEPKVLERLVRLAESVLVSEAMDRLCPDEGDRFIGQPLAVGAMDLNTARYVIDRETMRLSEE